MCLQVFLNAGMSRSRPPGADLVDGARRLGAAFQDVNFLRDLADDADALGRDYLGRAPTTSGAPCSMRIDADLAAAASVIPRLPADCRAAVTAAHDLFAELSRPPRSTPAGARPRPRPCQSHSCRPRPPGRLAPRGSRA